MPARRTLSKRQTVEARALYLEGASQKEVAAHYRVSRNVIVRLLRGETYDKVRTPTRRRGPRARTVAERFFSRVQEVDSGYWEWLGYRDKNGYGRIGVKLGSRWAMILTHRWSYGHYNQANPAAVCHSCDNPACVNPGHLFAGTQADNMKDAAQKGRMQRGEDRPMSKLLESDVQAIRASEEPQRALADRYGVHQSTIGRIQSRERWSWLGGCAIAIILLEKDPFVDAIGIRQDLVSRANVYVRRPFYGVSPKKNSFAYIAVRQLAGTSLRPISLFDSSAPGGWSNANHNFIIQDVQYQRQEKAQIVETFGDHFVFFYGERPTIVSVSGALLNTRDFNWKNEWLKNYDLYLRGTRCVENRARVFLSFDDVILSGYILSTAVTYDKTLPLFCPFSFTLLLYDYQDLSDNDDYVQDQRDAFQLEGGDRTWLPEYIETNLGTQPPTVRFEPDPVTGVSRPISGASGDVAMTQDDGLNGRTAFWVSGKEPHKKQWYSAQKAMFELDAQLAAQQNGVDDLTARLALIRDSSQFPLGSRSATVASIGESLLTGVRNYAEVVDDAPVLGG